MSIKFVYQLIYLCILNKYQTKYTSLFFVLVVNTTYADNVNASNADDDDDNKDNDLKNLKETASNLVKSIIEYAKTSTYNLDEQLSINQFQENSIKNDDNNSNNNLANFFEPNKIFNQNVNSDKQTQNDNIDNYNNNNNKIVDINLNQEENTRLLLLADKQLTIQSSELHLEDTVAASTPSTAEDSIVKKLGLENDDLMELLDSSDDLNAENAETHVLEFENRYFKELDSVNQSIKTEQNILNQDGKKK